MPGMNSNALSIDARHPVRVASAHPSVLQDRLA
jgi:hypothetical protein